MAARTVAALIFHFTFYSCIIALYHLLVPKEKSKADACYCHAEDTDDIVLQAVTPSLHQEMNIMDTKGIHKMKGLAEWVVDREESF